MLKGLALKYPFILILTLIFIFATSSYLLKLFLKARVPKTNYYADVKYACSIYNNGEVGMEELRTVIYGFLTEQCNEFSAKLKEDLDVEDIESIVGKKVVEIDECKLPKVNTGSVYVFTDDWTFNKGNFIEIKRREIRNGDLLICETMENR